METLDAKGMFCLLNCAYITMVAKQILIINTSLFGCHLTKDLSWRSLVLTFRSVVGHYIVLLCNISLKQDLIAVLNKYIADDEIEFFFFIKV